MDERVREQLEAKTAALMNEYIEAQREEVEMDTSGLWAVTWQGEVEAAAREGRKFKWVRVCPSAGEAAAEVKQWPSNYCIHEVRTK